MQVYSQFNFVLILADSESVKRKNQETIIPSGIQHYLPNLSLACEVCVNFLQ